MQKPLTIAWRNLLRNPERSLLAGITVFVGGFILLCSLFLADGISDGITKNLVAIESGSTLVTYQKKTDDIKDPSVFEKMHEHVAGVLGGLKPVTKVRVRMKFDALLFGPDGDSTTLTIKGIDPGSEVSLKDYLVPDSGHMVSVEGQGIYLSRQAADQLHVNTGDQITLMVNTWGDQINAMDFTVTGVFADIAPWADYVAYITLSNAQKLFAAKIANQYLIDTPHLSQAAGLTVQARDALRDQPVWVDSYESAGGFLLGIANANRYTFLAFSALLFVVVGLGIASLMSITVRERNPEFGMMLAFGFHTRQLLGLLMLEVTILAGLATLIALLIGAAVYAVLCQHGIALSGAARNAFGSARLIPAMHSYQIYVLLLACMGMALFGAFFPAWRIMKLSTDDILRKA